MVNKMAKLLVQDLSHNFAQNGFQLQVLNKINFSIEAGQFVALIGPSGCGKSTLFNIISGIVAPQVGEIYYNEKPIQSKTGLFGYMQQKDLLLPWRTVLRNVLIGSEINKESLSGAIKEAQILLTQLGLEGFAQQYPTQLSGGMRQRVALIRTLLFKKDTLLLDEPFGALDAMTRSMMQSILLDIWDKEKQTILLITHDLEEALVMADKIFVLTARPATIKAEVDVTLPRPRSITDAKLIRLKSDLYEMIQIEMEKVFDVESVSSVGVRLPRQFPA